jgi:hypothetical protein
MVQSKQEFIDRVNQQCKNEKAKGNSKCYITTASSIISGTVECISVGGLPVSTESPFFDDELLTDEDKETQKKVLKWIKQHCIRTKTINRRHSSYGLKHILERDTGIYLTNNQFKHAMLIEGHNPTNENDLNWYFRIGNRALHSNHWMNVWI